MPLAPSLLARLRADNPSLTFVRDDVDRWSPSTRTVYYNGDSPAIMLHELAHGLLEHTVFYQDVELLAIERAAWTLVRTTLAPRYNVKIDDDTIEDALDTYRAWLHLRSLCPDCNLNGLQRLDGSYLCPLCHGTWTASDGRSCQLRRYRTPTRTFAQTK